eukprot:3932048-Rhodomonas_salina.1
MQLKISKTVSRSPRAASGRRSHLNLTSTTVTPPTQQHITPGGGRAAREKTALPSSPITTFSSWWVVELHTPAHCDCTPVTRALAGPGECLVPVLVALNHDNQGIAPICACGFFLRTRKCSQRLVRRAGKAGVATLTATMPGGQGIDSGQLCS